MSAIAARIEELGLQLPAPAAPAGSYVPVAQTGNLLIVSGQLPFCDGSLLAEGPVPSTCSVEKAVEGAKQCGLNALSALQNHLGDLDRVSRVVRVGVFVASDPEFTAQPTVANGVDRSTSIASVGRRRKARSTTSEKSSLGCVAHSSMPWLVAELRRVSGSSPRRAVYSERSSSVSGPASTRWRRQA